ncbi:FecR family protein [Sphingomonas sp. CJ20]
MTTGYLQDREDEEAALWVARHMSDVVDATAFTQWLAGAPGRRARFDALWATCMDDAVTHGLLQHERRAQASVQAPERDRPRPGRRAAVGLAVAACAAVAVFSWPQLRFAMVPAQEFATVAGEVRSFTLADGSRVVLNGASRIRAKIDEGRREVALEAGEALFDVEHDEGRPFSVSAGQGRVTVLGTRFDLALNGDSVDLAVERGLVRFGNSGDASAVLVPAAHRSVLAEGRIATPTAFVGSSASDWRDGWLQVADMPLAQVVPHLQRWTGRSITVTDPALLRKRIAGRFRLSQPGVVLENLGVLYGFRVRQTERAYILERS